MKEEAQDDEVGEEIGAAASTISTATIVAAGAAEGYTWKCRFRGRCSTLDMVEIFDALKLRDRCSEP